MLQQLKRSIYVALFLTSCFLTAVGIMHPVAAEEGNETIPLAVVTLPNLETKVRDTFLECLLTSDLTDLGVLSLQGTVQYSSNLKLLSFDKGFLTSDGFAMAWNPKPDIGQLLFAGYGVEFLQGEGSLFCMRFEAIQAGTAEVELQNFMFNEWDPEEIAIKNAKITIRQVMYFPFVSR